MHDNWPIVKAQFYQKPQKQSIFLFQQDLYDETIFIWSHVQMLPMLNVFPMQLPQTIALLLMNLLYME